VGGGADFLSCMAWVMTVVVLVVVDDFVYLVLGSAKRAAF